MMANKSGQPLTNYGIKPYEYGAYAIRGEGRERREIAFETEDKPI